MENKNFKQRVRQFFSKKTVQDACEWTLLILGCIFGGLAIVAIYIVALLFWDNPIAFLLWGTVIPKSYAKNNEWDTEVVDNKVFSPLRAIFTLMEDELFKFLPWFAQKKYIEASDWGLSTWPVKSQVKYFKEAPDACKLATMSQEAQAEVASLETLPLFTERGINIDLSTLEKILQEKCVQKERLLTSYFTKKTPSEEAVNLLLDYRLYPVVWACVKKHGAFQSTIIKVLAMNDENVLKGFKSAVRYCQQMRLSLDQYKKYAAQGNKLEFGVIVYKLKTNAIDFIKEIYKHESKEVWKGEKIQLIIANSPEMTKLFLELQENQ